MTVRLRNVVEEFVLDPPVDAPGKYDTAAVRISVVHRSVRLANGRVSVSFKGVKLTSTGVPHHASTVDWRHPADDAAAEIAAMLPSSGAVFAEMVADLPPEPVDDEAQS